MAKCVAYNTIIMNNGANVHKFSDKWMFTNYENKNVAAYVTAVGDQKLIILGVGDIYNLKDVLHVQWIVKNSISLTFLARVGCSYFGQYDYCNLYVVNHKLLSSGQIYNENFICSGNTRII